MLEGTGTGGSSEEPPKDKPHLRRTVGVSEHFHLQGTSLRVPRPTDHLPEAPDALSLCSRRLHLPWTAAHRCWVSGEGGRRSSKPGTGAAVGRASRPGSPRPWLPPLSEACRIWAQKGPCSVACSAGMPPSSACPRPAWAPGPGPAVPQDSEARAPGRAAWWTGSPGLLHTWPQEGQRPSLGPRASVVCEAGLQLQPKGTLLPSPGVSPVFWTRFLSRGPGPGTQAGGLAWGAFRIQNTLTDPLSPRAGREPVHTFPLGTEAHRLPEQCTTGDPSSCWAGPCHLQPTPWAHWMSRREAGRGLAPDTTCGPLSQ